VHDTSVPSAASAAGRAWKLFLKGDRCFTEKCAIEKRNYVPGQHGKGARIKKQAQGYGLSSERSRR